MIRKRMLIELETRNMLNSPRTDTIRHTVRRENCANWSFFWKKKNLVGSWRSSRRLLLFSGFSVTVCVATLSERLLLEGGAWHHLHATLMSAASRPLLLSCRTGKSWRRDRDHIDKFGSNRRNVNIPTMTVERCTCAFERTLLLFLYCVANYI